ncbi:hypothetical protein AVDCRST_MAG92-2012 [uncultured Coleofasciculus sp.]|uniref:Uncharacterized protein n=1 Tax=uncultured Coleofasciculus sp. TaxID=1267456 RepID=A0A6J4IFR6_9CYAN|nr:hypothetical protein AVDCRST_MAG92-2012 [uncultured Coleofasciculus sp.]
MHDFRLLSAEWASSATDDLTDLTPSQAKQASELLFVTNCQ